MSSNYTSLNEGENNNQNTRIAAQMNKKQTPNARTIVNSFPYCDWLCVWPFFFNWHFVQVVAKHYAYYFDCLPSYSYYMILISILFVVNRFLNCRYLIFSLVAIAKWIKRALSMHNEKRKWNQLFDNNHTRSIKKMKKLKCLRLI